jgi:hypothetical protein
MVASSGRHAMRQCSGHVIASRDFFSSQLAHAKTHMEIRCLHRSRRWRRTYGRNLHRTMTLRASSERFRASFKRFAPWNLIYAAASDGDHD